MDIAQFKTLATQQLQRVYEAPERHALILILLAEVAGVPTYWYHSNLDYAFTPAVSQALQTALDRLAAGEPVQYVVGHVTFGGCRIQVDSRVLIPRPETEELLRHALSACQGAPLQVLDACTGSGCLAIAIKKQCPQARVFACDISESALEVAQSNAQANDVQVTFFNADVLQVEATAQTAFSYDWVGPGLDAPKGMSLLVSNPPYVTEQERAQMARRVLAYEPELALFVPNEDPLRFYNALAQLGLRLLRPGDAVLAEINQAYGPQTAALFDAKGYKKGVLLDDLFGKNRFISYLC